MERHVDAFLVEALENPRHRLTVLRMELEIQRFMQSTDQHQFEFPHLPTSYLRCMAHRVAQHYGLQTFAVDNTVDGSGTLDSKIIARKTPESKFPAVRLSEIPAKQTQTGITDQVKISIRQRPSTALNDGTELGNRRNLVRTVEERKEEYDKARARIFNGSGPTDLDGSSSMALADGRSFCSGRNDVEYSINTLEENEKSKDGASRVAIFRDREKDRWDPDYDRSYKKYVRGQVPYQNPGLVPPSAPYPQFLQYEACPQAGQLLRNPTPIGYRPLDPSVTPLCNFGCNLIIPKDAIYHMQWPNPSVMYAQSYGYLRHGIFQAPPYEQSLSFDH